MSKGQAFNTDLTDDDVRKIRQQLAEGRTRREVAKMWNLSITSVARIDRRDTFDWVPPEAPPMPVGVPLLSEQEIESAMKKLMKAQEEADKARGLK